MKYTAQQNLIAQPAAMSKNFSLVGCMLVMAAIVLMAAFSTNAQTASVYGQLGNFDVINHTGHDGHGFEIELDGLQPSDVYYSFSGERYGASHVTATATGILIRWESTVSGGAFDQTTLPYTGTGPFGGTCYMGGIGYANSGCEHFGASLTGRPTATHYRWLIEDSANPGTLVPFDPPVAIPNPVYVVTPPAQVGEAPILEAQVEAPEAAESPELYGDAQWMKVFKTELPREVTLDELLSDNPIVPQDAAHAEVTWEIVQAEPATNSNRPLGRARHGNSGALGFDTRSVIRRYETYTYTGAYDPITHEAMCADLTCSAPSDGELGDYIGAQMAAVNVTAQSLTVNNTGNGSVSSADRLIKCGTICQAGYNRAAAVTLTAAAGNGSIFTGWNGACSGNALTCILNIADATNVTANFSQVFAFQVKTSGKGSVAGDLGINCGRVCSANVVGGTRASITATPEAGFRFSSWTGACGSGVTCNLTINAATQVQANFVKQ